MLKFLLLLLVSSYSFYGRTSAAEVVIAVNTQNKSTITEEEVLKILRAETLTWKNGNSVILIIDNLENINSDAFNEVTNMTKSQFIEFWRIKFFSGRALIPKQVQSVSKALSILSENKNSIYISFDSKTSKELLNRPDIRKLDFNY